jgi:hypothetical protein
MRLSITGLLLVGLMIWSSLPAHAADPHAIIQKAIQAMGGQEKLAKYKSSISKGRCKFYGMGRAIECTAEWHVQPPRHLKAEYQMDMGGKIATRAEVIGKDQGWIVMNGKVRPLPAEQLAEIHEAMESEKLATMLVPLADPGYRLISLGESVVTDRPAVGIKVSRDGHADVLLYFDKEQGYLVRMQARSKAMGHEVEDETIYSDYQNYDGIRNARKTTTKRDGKLFLECEITDFKAVEQIPDSTFAKPQSNEGKKSPAAASSHEPGVAD